MVNVKKRGKDVKDASAIFASVMKLRTIILMENGRYIIHDILENGVNVIQSHDGEDEGDGSTITTDCHKTKS